MESLAWEVAGGRVIGHCIYHGILSWHHTARGHNVGPRGPGLLIKVVGRARRRTQAVQFTAHARMKSTFLRPMVASKLTYSHTVK